jgi:hypothetical protein
MLRTVTLSFLYRLVGRAVELMRVLTTVTSPPEGFSNRRRCCRCCSLPAPFVLASDAERRSQKRSQSGRPGLTGILMRT